MRLPRCGTQYLLSRDDLEELRQWQADQAFNRGLDASVRRAENITAAVHTPGCDIDLKKPSPALPLEYLSDPAWHDRFLEERRRRELRLMVIVQQAGLKLGPRGVVPHGVDLDGEY